MVDSNPVLVPAAGDQPEIVDLGTVAAENLALALNLGSEHVQTIRRAIRDEINAMSSHFSLAFADIQTQYEAEVLKVKSAYTYVSANVGKVIGAAAAVFAFGVIVGYVVR